MRLLELVVDEYGQDEEGEREREGERVSQSSGRKRSVGYVVIPFQRRSIVCFRKERDFLLSLIPAFLCYGFARICWYCAAYSQVGE